MKHKHCDVIKAWADGEQIQMYCPTTVPGEYQWADDNTPSWISRFKYRVKPKKPRKGWISHGTWAVELTEEVKAALKVAGIEYGEEK